MTKRGNPYFRGDIIVFCSQSLGGAHGAPISEYSLRERTDMSAIHCASTEMPDQNWSAVRDFIYPFGGCLHPMIERMRDRGLNPAVIHLNYSGSHSNSWYANRVAYAAWAVARLADLDAPNVRAIVTKQGEADAAVGPNGGDTWQNNWTAVIATLRGALALPVLPVVVGMVNDNYYPPNFDCPFLASTRASQEAFIAADGHAIGVYLNGQTYVDGIHEDYTSATRTGRALANAIS